MKLIVDGEVFTWQKQGGVSRIYREVLPRIAKMDPGADISVAAVSPLPGIFGPRVNIRKIPSLPVSLRPWRFWNIVRPLLNKWLWNAYWRTRCADVFISTYYTDPDVRMTKVCFVHDLIAELFGSCFPADWLKAELQRKESAIRAADMLLCNSSNTMNDLLRIYGVEQERCRVVLLAGFPERGLDATGIQAPVPESRFLLYVGDYRLRYKNFDFMLRTLAGDSSLNGYDLVVVSASVPTSEEIQMFSGMAGGRRIRFESNCDDDSLKALYSSCEAFIYPSLYEGFGIPVLEALGCGAPVVCSNTSSFPEVGGDAVYYFDPRLADEFAQAMKRALADGRDSGKVAQRKQQAGKFSWDRTAKGFMEVMRSAKRGRL